MTIRLAVLYLLLIYCGVALSQTLSSDNSCDSEELCTTSMAASRLRSLFKLVKPIKTSDGDGVTLSRSIGGPRIDHFDPFLLLDEFKSDDSSDYIGGFPDHPHRGFATVSYMLQGSMEHRDHMGNKGLLVPGSVQWMVAGAGVVHSEMPKQENGLLWGFQLWVNLPARHKMIRPVYQDLSPDRIPEKQLNNGGKVRVIAGEFDGIVGPVQDVGEVKPFYIDVTVPKGESFSHHVTEDLNVFAYIFEGKATVHLQDSVQSLEASNLVLYKQDGNEIKFTSAPDTHSRWLIIGGKPIGEPVARYGPFVMNTREELMQAVRDFQTGQLQK